MKANELGLLLVEKLKPEEKVTYLKVMEATNEEVLEGLGDTKENILRKFMDIMVYRCREEMNYGV